MLSIVLIVLKVIGCLLLFILLLLLAALALILFVPVRYRVAGEKYQEIRAAGDVTWLLHLLHVVFRFDSSLPGDKVDFCVRLLGRTVYPRKKGDGAGTPAEQEISPPGSKQTEKDVPPLETPAAPDPPEDRKETEMSPPPSGQETSRDAAADRKNKKVRRGPKKAREKGGASPLEKVQDKLRNLGKKAEEVREKKDKVMQIVENEKNQRWLGKVILRLKRLLIALLPQIDRLYLHFGFQDPSSTGKTLGLLSLLYPACEDRMILKPEFEEQVLEGDGAIGGSIRLVRLAMFALPSFVNPQFIRLIKQIKKL